MKTSGLTTTLGLIITALSFSLMSSCGSSGGSGTTSSQTPSSPATVLPQGRSVGFYAQTSNFYLPNYINNNSSLQVQSGMYQVLKEAMGVCDREHISGGLASCNTWMSGAFDLVLYAEGGHTSHSVKLIIRSLPGSQLGGYGWYSYSLPDFRQFIGCMLGICYSNPSGVFNPLVLEASIWPINNSQGFESRAYGPRISRAYNKLFQLQVAQGKLEDQAWNFNLIYNGVSAAQGRAVRCQSQFCGMDSSYFRTNY